MSTCEHQGRDTLLQTGLKLNVEESSAAVVEPRCVWLRVPVVCVLLYLLCIKNGKSTKKRETLFFSFYQREMGWFY